MSIGHMKLLLMVMTLAVAGLISKVNAANLLVNGDLGSGSDGWRFFKQKADKAEFRVAEDPEVGRYLSIKGDLKSGAPCWWFQEVAGQPDTEYTLSFLARGFGTHAESDRVVVAGVYFLSPEGGKYLSYKRLVDVTNRQAAFPDHTVADTRKWKRFKASFRTPPGVAKIGIRLDLMFGPAEAGFADLRLSTSSTDCLVANGGFEEWQSGAPAGKAGAVPTIVGGMAPAQWDLRLEVPETRENPSFPTGSAVAQDTSIKHSGKASLRIDNARTTDVAAVSSPIFDVLPGRSYTIKIWYKGEDIIPNPEDGQGVALIIAQGGEDIAHVNKTNLVTPQLRTGTFDWRLLEIRLKTSQTATKAAVTLQLRRAKGSAWFDDLAIAPTN